MLCRAGAQPGSDAAEAAVPALCPRDLPPAGPAHHPPPRSGRRRCALHAATSKTVHLLSSTCPPGLCSPFLPFAERACHVFATSHWLLILLRGYVVQHQACAKDALQSEPGWGCHACCSHWLHLLYVPINILHALLRLVRLCACDDRLSVAGSAAVEYMALLQELAGEPAAAAYLSARDRLMGQLAGLMAQLLQQLLANEAGLGSAGATALADSIGLLGGVAPSVELPTSQEAGDGVGGGPNILVIVSHPGLESWSMEATSEWLSMQSTLHVQCTWEAC